MKKIFKYPFEINDQVTIMMPRDAKILSIQDQKSNPCIWAMVDPDNDMEKRTFHIFGTGHPINDEDVVELEYVATFQMDKDDFAFVWHMFEKTKSTRRNIQ